MQKLVELNEEKLAALASDPQNIVYHWGSRERLHDDDIVPLDEVRDKILRFHSLCQKLKSDHKIKTVGKLKKLANLNAEWVQFERTHPVTYDRIVNLETTDKEIQALMYMIDLKSRESLGDITNGRDMLQQYLVKQFATDA